KAWPDTIALGDRIRVMGTLSENSGEDKINITTPEDIESLSHGAPPTPIEMNAKIDKQLEGQLVIFTGTFIEKRGSKLFLENSFEEVVVSVKSSTKITVPDLRPGSEVTVAGIVSQNNGVFQVLPRYQEDITATEPLLDTAKTPTNTETIHQTPKKESWPILTFLVLGMLVAGGVLVYQKWRTATLLREDEQRESHIES
ncbi:MAG TPA: hypothetical protein VJA22_02390, partial [Patescibacteria group bacterium]|nr:hypothetical protein [Patescibacteria group bacterium]